jgi:hypothetical protein
VTERPRIPWARLLLLTFATAALAAALQVLLAVSEAPAAEVITAVVIPATAGAIVFAGLEPYPLAGRLRMGLMVAFSLLLLGLLLG